MFHYTGHLVAAYRAPVGRVKGQDDFFSCEFAEPDLLIGRAEQFEIRGRSTFLQHNVEMSPEITNLCYITLTKHCCIMLTAVKNFGRLPLMAVTLVLTALLPAAFEGQAQTFRVTITPALQQGALDGRLLLLLANNDKAEPRFQINDAAGTQMVFGVDVEGWQPGTTQLVDMRAFGYPLERTEGCAGGRLLCAGAAA
jgi:hypothetical protein